MTLNYITIRISQLVGDSTGLFHLRANQTGTISSINTVGLVNYAGSTLLIPENFVFGMYLQYLNKYSSYKTPKITSITAGTNILRGTFNFKSCIVPESATLTTVLYISF